MEVFLHPSILQADCNKYLLKEIFGSGSATLEKMLVTSLKISTCQITHRLGRFLVKNTRRTCSFFAYSFHSFEGLNADK